MWPLVCSVRWVLERTPLEYLLRVHPLSASCPFLNALLMIASYRNQLQRRGCLLYKSAKERALLLVFLHPHRKSEEEHRLLLKHQVTEWVVVSSAAPAPLGSRMSFRWRMWCVFAAVHLADSCCSGFSWSQDSTGIKHEPLPSGLSATLSTF